MCICITNPPCCVCTWNIVSQLYFNYMYISRKNFLIKKKLKKQLSTLSCNPHCWHEEGQENKQVEYNWISHFGRLSISNLVSHEDNASDHV